jgi:hypothetical protein
MAALLSGTSRVPNFCHHGTTQLSPAARPYEYGRVVLVHWTPPPNGWVKLNFDGSVYHDGSGRASIGGAIRDSAGRVVLAFSELTEHSTVGIVEARARSAAGCGRGGRPRAGAAPPWGGHADADPCRVAGGNPCATLLFFSLRRETCV